jgi:hypothetical protein
MRLIGGRRFGATSHIATMTCDTANARHYNSPMVANEILPIVHDLAQVQGGRRELLGFTCC